MKFEINSKKHKFSLDMHPNVQVQACMEYATIVHINLPDQVLQIRVSPDYETTPDIAVELFDK